MLTKVQFTIQINAKVFLKLYLFNRVVIKFHWRVCCLFYLTRKITSCVCLLRSGLKVIFHRFANAFILLKSLFKLFADTFILSTAEKREKLSAKCLIFVVRSSERSLYRSNIRMLFSKFQVVNESM